MSKILYASCTGISVVISTQFTLKICVTDRNCHKIHKNPILAFKVIQGHCSQCQSKASVLPPISDYQ